jgi:hypothetical protein
MTPLATKQAKNARAHKKQTSHPLDLRAPGWDELTGPPVRSRYGLGTCDLEVMIEMTANASLTAYSLQKWRSFNVQDYHFLLDCR